MREHIAVLRFSDQERAVIQAVADERGLSFEETVEALAAEAFAAGVHRLSGSTVAAQVRRFHGGGGK